MRFEDSPQSHEAHRFWHRLWLLMGRSPSRLWVVLLGLMVAVVGLILFLPVIRVSPSQVVPVVKISGVDWLHSRLLGSSAQRDADLGRLEAALRGYERALSKNPGDLPLTRAYLSFLQESEQTASYLDRSLQLSLRLVTWSPKDPEDLALAVDVLSRAGRASTVVSLLRFREDEVTSRSKLGYLRSLFELGQFEEFGRVWDQVKVIDGVPLYSEAELYRWAVDAMVSKGEAALPHLRRLEQRVDSTPLGRAAAHLGFKVALELKDPDAAEQRLAALVALGLDRFAEHVMLWRLWMERGREDQAFRLAQMRSINTGSAIEVGLIAGFWRDARRPLLALAVLKELVPPATRTWELWYMEGRLLFEQGDWDEVRAFALRVRSATPWFHGQAVYSHFLEGVADFHQYHSARALAAFERMTRSGKLPFSIALEASNWLSTNGFLEQSVALLENLKTSEAANPVFWETLWEFSTRLRKEVVVLQAAAALTRLRPGDPMAQSRYCEALLVTRLGAPEALRLSYSIIHSLSNEPSAHLLHGIALGRNKHYDEALAVLEPLGINETELRHRSMRGLALCENLIAQGRAEAAMAFLREIRTSTLFPSERLLLEFVTLGRVPPKVKTSMKAALEPIWREVPQLATDGRGAAWMAAGAGGGGKPVSGGSSLFNRMVTDPVFVVLLCATLGFVAFVARLYRRPDPSLVTMAAMLETEAESERNGLGNTTGLAPAHDAGAVPGSVASVQASEIQMQPEPEPGALISKPAKVGEGESVEPSTSVAVPGTELGAGAATSVSDDREPTGVVKPIPFVMPEDRAVVEPEGKTASEPIPAPLAAAPEVTAASLFKAKRPRPSRGPVGG